MRLYTEFKSYLAAVDCIIFGYDISGKDLKLLLIKRSLTPARGKWSLAGGFVEPEESLDVAASRVLKSLTGLENVFMKQLYTFGDVGRDPGARVISTAYWALIKIEDIKDGIRTAHGAHWQSLRRVPELIFDHNRMLSMAVEELRRQIRIKPAGFELLPEKFTLVQLLDLYEAISGKKIDKRNFRKKILSMNVLEKLDEKDKGSSRKGAFYYCFNRERYKILEENGFYFNLDVS